jgi:hypothetical protein
MSSEKQAISIKEVDWSGTLFSMVGSLFKVTIFLVHMVFMAGRGAFQKVQKEWKELEPK